MILILQILSIVLKNYLSNQQIEHVIETVEKQMQNTCTCVKRNGKLCGKKCPGFNLCKLHLKTTEVQRCKFILQRGKNKNKSCTKRVYSDGLCKNHQNKHVDLHH